MQIIREPCLVGLWDITTPDGADRRFRDDVFRQLPYRFRNFVASSYRDAFNAGGIAGANGMLLDVSDVIKGAAGRIAGNDTELCDWAAKKARDCGRVAASMDDQDNALLVLSEIATRSGIAAPDMSKSMTVAGAIKRLCCDKWWRRQARKSQGRGVEAAAIKLHMVHRYADLYASDESVERRAGQKRRNRLMLESCLAVNELGDEFTLAELSDLSVSNPKIRRGELMVRMSGFESIAKKSGHVGYFFTWTCPSRMHAHLSTRGAINPAYDGTIPRAAQQYLCGQWAKARAALARKNINLYGFRVAEPHHDGCPHWHMLFFMSPESVSDVCEVLRHYALQVDGNEVGAKKHRFKAVKIDFNRGTATGYLAKYVAKNIDGFGIDSVDEDIFGRSPEACAARVDAWASTWGIRQFQQIGGASVTVWRELRKLREAVDVPEIEAARLPANAEDADWCGYLEAQAVAKVSLHRAWSDKEGEYGEPLGWKIVGVEHNSVAVATRVHEWTLRRQSRAERILSAMSPMAFGIFEDLAAKRPWSPVNNYTCTEGEKCKEGQTGRKSIREYAHGAGEKYRIRVPDSPENGAVRHID